MAIPLYPQDAEVLRSDVDKPLQYVRTVGLPRTVGIRQVFLPLSLRPKAWLGEDGEMLQVRLEAIWKESLGPTDVGSHWQSFASHRLAVPMGLSSRANVDYTEQTICLLRPPELNLCPPTRGSDSTQAEDSQLGPERPWKYWLILCSSSSSTNSKWIGLDGISSSGANVGAGCYP